MCIILELWASDMWLSALLTMELASSDAYISSRVKKRLKVL